MIQTQISIERNLPRKTGELYFIISLGEELDEWHYKLIAGIIDMKIED